MIATPFFLVAQSKLTNSFSLILTSHWNKLKNIQKGLSTILISVGVLA